MRYYREPIYLMLLRMTHSPVDADDLTIETFGKAISGTGTFGSSNFGKAMAKGGSVGAALRIVGLESLDLRESVTDGF